MSEMLGLFITFLPLFVIIWMANLSEARRIRDEPYETLALITYLALSVLYGLGLFFGLLAQVGAWVAATDPSLFAGLGADIPAASLPLLALGFWLPSLVGIILLLPPVRRFFARFTDIDPESPVHAVALSFTMLVVINLLVTLGIGLGNMADMIASAEDGESNTIALLWGQQILTALLAVVGVGWLTRRTWGESFARLGLVVPSGRQTLIGVGVGLTMVPVVLLIEFVATEFGLQASPDVERLTEELLGSLFTTPLGILTLGLSAGLGEETLFRGAILPKFGLLFTSILFALVHSNYGITLSTLVVLLMGLVLGWLRLRYNTSTSMITHAVYNMTLGLLAYLSTTNMDF